MRIKRQNHLEMDTSGEELIDVYADSSTFTTPNITPSKNGNAINSIEINMDESDKIPTSMDENMNEEFEWDEDDMESDDIMENSEMEDLESFDNNDFKRQKKGDENLSDFMKFDQNDKDTKMQQKEINDLDMFRAKHK